MRKPNSMLAMAGVVVASVAAGARSAAFVNLDFESATVVSQNPNFGFLEWNLAVPGWQHNSGADLGIVYYGGPHLGQTGWYMLFDSQSPTHAPGTQLAGNYSVGFINGLRINGTQSSFQQNFLSQTGDISADAKSIRLLARGPFNVFVGGNRILMLSLGGNAYGGDISMYGGMTSELKIVNTSVYNDPLMFDNIEFSPVSIPEPVSLAAVLATLAPMRARGRRR